MTTIETHGNRIAVLLASLRDIAAINPLVGIASGAGNQGSACRANLQGHAGTPGTKLGSPRMLNFGQGWEA